MNIAIVTQKVDKDDSILGFFHKWLEELASKFSQVKVICLEEGRVELPDNVEVHSLGKEKGVSKIGYVLNFYKYFFNFLFFGQFDVFFVHMNAIYIILLTPFKWLLGVMGKPLGWWKTHGHLNLKAKFSVLIVDVIFTASDYSFPLDTYKKKSVGHGINTDDFTLKRKFNSKENLKIISVGRISRTKTYEDLIRAVSLFDEKERKNIDVTIIGTTKGPEDKKYYEDLNNLIDEKDLGNTIRFISSVPHNEIKSYYNSADILVNSSKTNSIDKVVLEAMSCGTIPITSNPAFSKMLSEYDYCTYSKEDIFGLKQSIKKIDNLAPEKKKKIGKELRQIVKKEHNLKTLIDRIYTHYGRLLKE